MSKEQSQQLIEIQIDSAKEDLEYKRLLNLEKKIEINSKLSNLLTEKLVNIDSDYRIEIGEAFLLEQKDGKVKYNKDLILDLPFEKEIFDEENQDESENDQGPNLVSTPKKPKRS
ncbi:MAG: hypothetical protein IPQ02_08365 [Saprospiraceae bacterium]|nr:hypothetical protein [Candidatus Defluviibacterium haderslevense]